MSLQTSVTPQVIATYLGEDAPDPSDPRFEQWKMLIADALMLIEARRVELDKPESEIDSDRLNYVIRQAVAAFIRRPDDATQVSVSVDDGSESRSYSTGRGRVFILDEWWKWLGLGGSGSRAKAYSIDTAPGLRDPGVHVPWCSLAWGDPCSCGANLAGFPLYETGGY